MTITKEDVINFLEGWHYVSSHIAPYFLLMTPSAWIDPNSSFRSPSPTSPTFLVNPQHQRKTPYTAHSAANNAGHNSDADYERSRRYGPSGTGA